MDKITSRILAVMIPLCFIAWFMMFAWMSTPAEWEVKINLTADDNVLEIVETVEEMQNKSAEIKWSKEAPEVWYYLSEDYKNITINGEACESVPCECHKWGCALMCYYCEDKINPVGE